MSKSVLGNAGKASFSSEAGPERPDFAIVNGEILSGEAGWLLESEEK